LQGDVKASAAVQPMLSSSIEGDCADGGDAKIQNLFFHETQQLHRKGNFHKLYNQFKKTRQTKGTT